MGRPRRKQNPDFGTIAIGVADTPIAMKKEDTTPTKEQTKALEAKIAEYRKDNPEPPKNNTTPIQTPLNIKRVTSSFDDEYIELAKRYLGIKTDGKPTMLDLAKGVIRLFDDNIKMYKKLHSISNQNRLNVSIAPKHSWQMSEQWN